jgi:hypothetical protein
MWVSRTAVSLEHWRGVESSLRGFISVKSTNFFTGDANSISVRALVCYGFEKKSALNFLVRGGDFQSC